MFNRKKHEIERLRAENKELLRAAETAKRMRAYEVGQLKDRIYEAQEACADECSGMAGKVGDLTTENDKLRQLLAAANDQAAQAEADKRRLQGENRALREKIEEAQRHSTCPADCVHRTNPNACRTCIRYPKARDKYEATS